MISKTTRFLSFHVFFLPYSAYFSIIILIRFYRRSSMKILICDDDSSITQSLSLIIKTYFNKKKVNNLDIVTFNDGDSLLSDKSQKDIVFLDIEMPGFDGIYVGNELKKQNDSVIIFIVTSYLEYLDAAMRFHV